MKLSNLFTILEWGRSYSTSAFTSDAVAAIVVTIMLIPQSLAYAMLAGLPPQAGLYASMLPLVAYAVFGTSRTLAVGPVAVISLMTAAAAGRIAEVGSEAYLAATLLLALMSGLFLLGMGLFRLGFLANFLSHPVISGFITASGLLIAASQLKHILGIDAGGHTIWEITHSLWEGRDGLNLFTLITGITALIFLSWVRNGFEPLLRALGLNEYMARLLARTGPILAVIAAILAVTGFGLEAYGVATVGKVPQSLPPLTIPDWDPEMIRLLITSAIMISIVGFVESISVARTLAAKRRQQIDPDRELTGLGAANIAAAFTGGYPVTGGFARSVVNFDAGAETPMAGIMTAVGIGIAALLLTPLLEHLPNAVLSATIIVAVLSLVKLDELVRAWAYSKRDFSAMALTILVTLALGVEMGIISGVLLSLALFLYRTSTPHSAIVGQVPGTEHFRNIERHDVVTADHIVMLRVDEALYFANARYLENKVQSLVIDCPEVKHVILMCPAINFIDLSALETLEAINERLRDAGVILHLSEVKGPVMDRLRRTHFLQDLTGQVYLSQYEAFKALAPELAEQTLHAGNPDMRPDTEV